MMEVAEQKKRRFRKLRIAWSALWGIVTVLVCVLWWQSRTEIKGITSHVIPHRFTMVLSLLGEVGVAHGIDWEERVQTPHGELNHFSKESPGQGEYSYINRGPYPRLTGKMPPFKARLRWYRAKYHWYIGAPHWLIVLFIATIGAVPWLRPSRAYSLRTLLIVTTLVAVVLGLAIWVTRK
jgi:hypothetical protein